MLINDFYTVSDINKEENTIEGQIKLNVNHSIYEGHFPEQPVTPGVCMMQMMAEVSALVLKTPLKVKSASQMKFLIPIVPDKNPEINIKISLKEKEEGYLATGTLYNGEQTFFKFKGILAE